MAAVMGGTALIVALMAVVVVRRRMRRRWSLGEGADPGELLRGLLCQPSAFAALPDLGLRPLVPVLAGRPISLDRARCLAARGALFSTATRCDLAVRAAAKGTTVVDASEAAGQVVAELIGAADLDSWESLLSQRSRTPFTKALDQVLAGAGLGWRVWLVDRARAPLTTLELPELELSVVAVDRRAPLVRHVEASHGKQPAAAVLVLGDAVVHHLELRSPRARSMLADLARRAVSEAARA